MAPIFIFGLLRALVICAIILGSVLIILKYYFELQKKHSSASPAVVNRSEEQKILLPLRLQACERIILFLERISPGNIVMRLNRPDISAAQLQSEILKTIREEYEYNLSQQLYITLKAWELVKNAKEETITMVNLAAGKVSSGGTGNELVKNIFELALQSEKLPVDMAIEEIKKEIQQLF